MSVFTGLVHFCFFILCGGIRGGNLIRDKEQIKSDKKSAFPFPLAVFPLTIRLRLVCSDLSLSTLILCRFFVCGNVKDYRIALAGEEEV